MKMIGLVGTVSSRIVLWSEIEGLAMAKFNVQFLDSGDDLSLLTQEYREDRNINDVFLMTWRNYLILQGIVLLEAWSILIVSLNLTSEEIISVAYHYRPLVEDISEDNE